MRQDFSFKNSKLIVQQIKLLQELTNVTIIKPEKINMLAKKHPENEKWVNNVIKS